MNKEEQKHVIDCLQTIVKLAGESTHDSRVLAIHTMYVLKALNFLFEKKDYNQ